MHTEGTEVMHTEGTGVVGGELEFAAQWCAQENHSWQGCLACLRGRAAITTAHA